MVENGTTVRMDDVQLIYRNFRGKPTPFNKEGTMNFGVLLPTEELAQRMLADEWNVKWLKKREDDETEEPTPPFLPVELRYDGLRPPRVVAVTSRGRENLDEDDVKQLDWLDIKSVDIIVRAYCWTNGEKSGVKAYAQTMFVQIEEDELEQKWAERPSPQG